MTAVMAKHDFENEMLRAEVVRLTTHIEVAKVQSAAAAEAAATAALANYRSHGTVQTPNATLRSVRF